MPIPIGSGNRQEEQFGCYLSSLTIPAYRPTRAGSKGFWRQPRAADAGSSGNSSAVSSPGNSSRFLDQSLQLGSTGRVPRPAAQGGQVPKIDLIACCCRKIQGHNHHQRSLQYRLSSSRRQSLFSSNRHVRGSWIALPRFRPEVIWLVNRLGAAGNDQWPLGVKGPRLADCVISPLRVNMHAGYQQHLNRTAIETSPDSA